MAKEKSKSGEIEPVSLGDAGAPPAATEGASAPDFQSQSELDALRAKVAELEAKLAAPPAAPVALADDPPGRFQVSLLDAPTWIVEAQSSAHAWEAYKAATGMISSINTPSVSRVPDDSPLGRVLAAKA